VCDDLHVALLRRMYEAGSLLTILPIQDLFGWRERINTPATTERHNWSYRLPVETSGLDMLPGVRDRMEVVRRMIDETGRSMR
jgi:4-alpha-glucanotransferase